MIHEKALGPDDLNLAATINYLAVLYSQQGKYAEAEPLFRESLEMKKRAYGETPHEDVAIGMDNLATVLRRLKKDGEAEQLHRQALEIDKKVHGDEHPDVAQSLNGLAQTLRKQNPDSAEALRLGKQALAILG